jgi:phytoene desaturase
MKIAVIGSGFGGLTAACFLAKAGHHVEVYEKNEMTGGRASVFEAEGFTFDMGPSWYLMPEVFEHFFIQMDEKIEDYLDLVKLDPSYQVFFEGKEAPVTIYSDLTKDAATIERLEPGAGKKLEAYLKKCANLYDIVIKKFLYRSYPTIGSMLSFENALSGAKMPILSKMHAYVGKTFKSDEVRKLLQYTLVFLGSSPYNAPAVYSMLTHTDFNQGVFYPQGGIYTVVQAMEAIARKHGVVFHLNTPVTAITTVAGKATGVQLAHGKHVTYDVVVSNADLHFTETHLLSPPDRTYPESFWKRSVQAPSALLIYLGIKGKVDGLLHHNLYFCKDWKENFAQIFDHPQWPDNPSFYVSAPSKTDACVAPEGDENLFILVPLACGLTYSSTFLEGYADMILRQIETQMHIPGLCQRITYKRLFGPNDFEQRYNSYRGTGLGLAHTFSQTGPFRPDLRSKKVSNLFYTGANVHPGIGMPVCLISGELTAQHILSTYPHS